MLEKILAPLYISVKEKIFPQRFEKKNSYSSQITLKVKWSTTKECCKLFKLVYYFPFLTLNAD